MIRIMLVDDQRFARLGFQLMLDDASDIVVTAQSADGRSAIETLEQLAVQHRPLPNVILMDVRMPGMDGIEATRRITRRWPTISILILTTYDEDDYAFGGLDAGASGFLLKDVTKHNLIDAVHAIANGDAILTPRITRQVRLNEAFRIPPAASASKKCAKLSTHSPLASVKSAHSSPKGSSTRKSPINSPSNLPPSNVP